MNSARALTTRSVGRRGWTVAATAAALLLGSIATGGAALAVDPPVSTTDVPTISGATAGTILAGETITADPGSWTPSDTVFTYEWVLSDGRAVVDTVADNTFALPLDAAGLDLTVQVTGEATGYSEETVASATYPVAYNAFSDSLDPSLSSSAPTVGSTLTVTTNALDPTPRLTYRWYRGTNQVSTDDSYPVTAADLGATIEVEVTATTDGYTSITETSPATATVTVGSFSGALIPTLGGSTTVGSTLTVTAGQLVPAPDATTYRWYRGATPITGVTGTRYPLTAADLGAHIEVVVTGTGATSGYADHVETSAATTAITRGTLVRTALPKISGNAVAGEQLSASSGTWNRTPTTVTYQWNRDGKDIPGATKSRYTLTGADYKTKITVTATATLAGYAAAYGTSAPTTKVAGPYALLVEDGYYEVSDFGAGTYMSSNSAKASCYWERRTNAGEGKKGFVASDIGGGQQIVTIAATDKYFYTEGCGTWTKFVAIGKPVTTVGNGTYAVTSQLSPGKYKTTTATKSCWWARMSGYPGYSWTGANAKLIATVQNDAKTQTVTVKAGDTGFQTQGCGTWKRISR